MKKAEKMLKGLKCDELSFMELKADKEKKKSFKKEVLEEIERKQCDVPKIPKN